MALKITFLCLAGMLGTMARFWLGAYVQQRLAHSMAFPWGTLAVNLTGCLLAGLIWAILEPDMIASQARLFILVGFMGAFTTFSSFVLETSELLREARWGFAMANVLLHNIGGFALFFLGFSAGKHL